MSPPWSPRCLFHRLRWPSRNGAGYPDELLSGKSVGLNTLEPLDICILLGSPPNGAMAGSLPQGATPQRDGLLLEGLRQAGLLRLLSSQNGPSRKNQRGRRRPMPKVKQTSRQGHEIDASDPKPHIHAVAWTEPWVSEPMVSRFPLRKTLFLQEKSGLYQS